MAAFTHKKNGRMWILPKHTRPVPSNVRPSGHSQWKDPLLLTQRPFGQTPGNTSHSLTSVGKWSKQRDKEVTNRKSRCTSGVAYSKFNTMWIITELSRNIPQHRFSQVPTVKIITALPVHKKPRHAPLPAVLCLKG